MRILSFRATFTVGGEPIDLRAGLGVRGRAEFARAAQAGVTFCVGPGTLTVQQVKNFSFNSSIGF